MSRRFTSNVEFSWKQFFISFVYENLPPVLLSPLAALIIERSFVGAFRVSQHRGLCAVSLRYISLPFLLTNWLIVYPGSWLITAGLVVSLTDIGGNSLTLDPLQMIIAYSLLFTRRVIICVKYAYFTKADFQALSAKAPDWDFNKTRRRLIAQGWARPSAFPGLLETELQDTMQVVDIDLAALNLPTQNGQTTDMQTIATGLVAQAYQDPRPSWMDPMVFLAALSILLSLWGVKYAYNIPLLGDTGPAMIVSLAVYFGIITGLGIMGFGLSCAFDFERRTRIAGLFHQALIAPGVQTPLAHNQSLTVYFNKHDPQSVHAWVQARTVLRNFGERFYLRVQSYTSILIVYSILAVGALNLLAWTQIPHHVSTVAMLCVIIFVISLINAYAMVKAMNLQRASYRQRSALQEDLLALEVESAMLSKSQADGDALGRVNSAKMLLQQVDENLNFEELLYRPTTVLGNRADNGLIGSVLGIVVTLALLALQGFASTGVSYDVTGWFR